MAEFGEQLNLDIIDENGNPTGEIVEREKAHAEGIMHRTSHVWLYRVRWMDFGELITAVSEKLIPHCISNEELKMLAKTLKIEKRSL